MKNILCYFGWFLVGFSFYMGIFENLISKNYGANISIASSFGIFLFGIFLMIKSENLDE